MVWQFYEIIVQDIVSYETLLSTTYNIENSRIYSLQPSIHIQCKTIKGEAEAMLIVLNR